MSKATLKLDWCSYETAKYAVEKWHYSHCMPAGKTVKVGAWENGQFIGVIIFSRGANNNIGKPYGLDQTQICELTRVALQKHINSVSRIVSIAMKLLAKQSPEIRLIVSFADPSQNHNGSIYQAMNWIYAGTSRAADEYIVNGKRMHGRSMRSIYGSHIGKSFIEKTSGSSKYRYLYPLDDAMRKQIDPLRKPYPKRLHAVEVNKDTSGDQPEEGGAIPTQPLNPSSE